MGRRLRGLAADAAAVAGWGAGVVMAEKFDEKCRLRLTVLCFQLLNINHSNTITSSAPPQLAQGLQARCQCGGQRIGRPGDQAAIATHRAAREMVPRPQRIAARSHGFGPAALRAGVGVGLGADGHGFLNFRTKLWLHETRCFRIWCL